VAASIAGRRARRRGCRQPSAGGGGGHQSRTGGVGGGGVARKKPRCQVRLRREVEDEGVRRENGESEPFILHPTTVAADLAKRYRGVMSSSSSSPPSPLSIFFFFPLFLP